MGNFVQPRNEMRGIAVGILIVLLAGCSASTPAASPSPSGPAPTPSEEPTALPSVAPTAGASLPTSVTVTFRLTLTGSVPADAVFALQSGIVDGAGGAIYLCSYYGGWPVCETGRAYEDALSFPPGTRVTYRFWRELDVNGTSEEIEAGEFTVGGSDQVISVTYAFLP